jgi:hypothetical protein
MNSWHFVVKNNKYSNILLHYDRNIMKQRQTKTILYKVYFMFTLTHNVRNMIPYKEKQK